MTYQLPPQGGKIEITPEMIAAGAEALGDGLEGLVALSDISTRTVLVRALHAALTTGNYRVSLPAGIW